MRMPFDQAATQKNGDANYSIGKWEPWLSNSTGQLHHRKQRSLEHVRSSVTNRLANRFPSLSRRWKNKSHGDAHLAVVTHPDRQNPRVASAATAELISPTLSAISKHESYLVPSPVRPSFENNTSGFASPPSAEIDETAPDEEEELGVATTPLLPPIFTELAREPSPIQSPLQSPSVASAPSMPVSPHTTQPSETTYIPNTPSPQLSTKPSLSSLLQPSRANTTSYPIPLEIPTLSMSDDRHDPWADRLGHANFDIYPEPYTPMTIDLDSYREYRANWDLARCNYAKHLARTGEHYGVTSRVYLLTQEKWNWIDGQWRNHYDEIGVIVAPQFARISDGTTNGGGSAQSSLVLEKPVTKIVVPPLADASGKFPELGDEDIVGPMTVAPARAEAMQKRTLEPGQLRSMRKKRNVFRFVSDMFGRGNPIHT